MNFFKHFPTINYGFDSNGQYTLSLTDPTARVKILERVQQHVTVFYDYVIQEGDRPDTVAQKVYGAVDYTWIVLLVNNIFSLYDWPMNSDEFNRFIVDKYGSVALAQNLANPETLYHNAAGFRVDAATYALLDGSDQGVITSAYDDELQKNEDKRRIKVIPQAFVGQLMVELKRIFA